MLKDSFKGSAFTVTHCVGWKKSLVKALQGVPAHERSKMVNKLSLQIERLADGKRSSDFNARQEGKLPSFGGKPKKNFYAIKKIPIRGYFWDSERFEMTYFISHYIFKDFDKLSEQDTRKVHNNWHRIEGGNDDF